MRNVQPVSPTFCYPLIGMRGDQHGDGVVADVEDEIVDPKMAALGEPIVGTERIVYDDSNGPGALPARALPSPKAITANQRSIHDLTHLPISSRM